MASTEKDMRSDSVPKVDMLRTAVRNQDYETLMEHMDLIRKCHKGFYDDESFTFSGWDPNNRYYDTLHEAVRYNNMEMVEWLLNHGCPVMAVDSSIPANTAMHIACSEGNLEMCKLLYAHDARLANLINYFAETPLMIACSRGRVEADIIKMISKAGKLDDDIVSVMIRRNMYRHDDALRISAGNHLAVVEWLVTDCGVKVDQVPMVPEDARHRKFAPNTEFNDVERLPLFQAAYYGHIEIANWLVDSAGAQEPSFLARPNIRELEDTSQSSMFDDATRIVKYAADKNKWKVLKWLFQERKVDPNCRSNANKDSDSHLQVPLSYAMKKRNRDCEQFLCTLPNINVRLQKCGISIFDSIIPMMKSHYN